MWRPRVGVMQRTLRLRMTLLYQFQITAQKSHKRTLCGFSTFKIIPAHRMIKRLRKLFLTNTVIRVNYLNDKVVVWCLLYSGYLRGKKRGRMQHMKSWPIGVIMCYDATGDTVPQLRDCSTGGRQPHTSRWCECNEDIWARPLATFCALTR